MFDSRLQFLDRLLEWIIQACGRVVHNTVSKLLIKSPTQTTLSLFNHHQSAGVAGFPYDSLNRQTQSKVVDEKD